MNISKVFERAVREAEIAIAKISRTDLGVDAKGDRDLVTSADRASQEVILEILTKEFPGTFILAEEQEKHTIPVSTYLVVDPIDGTYNFLHGAPDWGITIGLIENGRPKAGVMSLPVQKTLISAERGDGCFLNGQRITLSKPPALKRSLIGTEIGWFVGEELLQKRVLPLAEKALGIRCVLGAVASATEVLRGITKAYVNFHGAKVWDFAAGAVAVEEAGGYCVSCSGAPLAWDTVFMDALFASSKEIADEILGIT